MPRRILEGNVVSAKNNKTITVLVERRFMHPMYKKYIKSTTKYTAHDEANTAQEGDRVSIIECRPISKTKRWALVTGDEAAAPVEKKPAAKKAAAPAKAKEEKAAKDEKPAAKAKKAPAKKPAAKKEAKATKKDAK